MGVAYIARFSISLMDLCQVHATFHEGTIQKWKLVRDELDDCLSSKALNELNIVSGCRLESL